MRLWAAAAALVGTGLPLALMGWALASRGDGPARLGDVCQGPPAYPGATAPAGELASLREAVERYALRLAGEERATAVGHVPLLWSLAGQRAEVREHLRLRRESGQGEMRAYHLALERKGGGWRVTAAGEIAAWPDEGRGCPMALDPSAWREERLTAGVCPPLGLAEGKHSFAPLQLALRLGAPQAEELPQPGELEALAGAVQCYFLATSRALASLEEGGLAEVATGGELARLRQELTLRRQERAPLLEEEARHHRLLLIQWLGDRAVVDSYFSVRFLTAAGEELEERHVYSLALVRTEAGWRVENVLDVSAGEAAASDDAGANAS